LIIIVPLLALPPVAVAELWTLGISAMPIATINAVLTVTPHDQVQILRGKGNYEFVDDKTPFRVKVSEVMRESGGIIGVFGPVIDGPSRYSGMIATILTRLDGSHFETDMHTQANFKVGQTSARRVTDYPHSHPEGTVIDGYPQIIRFGGVDADA
jgi:hypothetical protein